MSTDQALAFLASDEKAAVQRLIDWRVARLERALTLKPWMAALRTAWPERQAVAHKGVSGWHGLSGL